MDDDGIEWPVTYLRDLMRTCSVTVGTFPNSISWSQISGMDQLIACMEHNPSAFAEAPPYFQNTWRTFSSYIESAPEPSGWTQTKVSQMWQYDLYKVGSRP